MSVVFDLLSNVCAGCKPMSVVFDLLSSVCAGCKPMLVVFDVLSKVSVLDVNPCQWCLTCCLKCLCWM
jgi:hypothetical protein